jgi:peptidoglycan lytic transglycosylase G
VTEESEHTTEAVAAEPGRKIRKIVLVVGVLFLSLIVVVSGAAGGAFYYGKHQFEASGPSLNGDSADYIFTLPRGQGLTEIAQNLEEKGLVTNAWIFRLGVMWYHAQSQLKAGEYAIPSEASMSQIMEILRQGKSILYKFTAPEGLTSAQIIQLIEADETLIGPVDSIPAEGMLLPETYLFQRGTTRRELIDQMTKAAQEALSRLWKNRADGLPVSSREEALVLASIVEKETGLPEERPRVAAVFINRLSRGMRLESDPTVIYGLTKGEPLGRGLRVSELKKVTPYNTYEIDGLPPTPIGNPGVQSLAAVLNPPETKDLFFVANGSGGHLFATNYRQHQRNVAQWRRIEKERKSNH